MSYSVKYEDIGLRDYKEVWDYQARIFKDLVERKKAGDSYKNRKSGSIPGTLIFVEHPNVFTLGKNGSEDNLLMDISRLETDKVSYYRIDRGGDITYHGPGQIVGYPIFDLEAIGTGLKQYIFRVEESIIKSLSVLGIKGSRLENGTGVWIDPHIPGKARKICAIGVKASKFVTMHGFAFNVNTDLQFFNYINPCGFRDKGVTSLEKELGEKQDMNKIKLIVKESFGDIFDLEWNEQ